MQEATSLAIEAGWSTHEKSLIEDFRTRHASWLLSILSVPSKAGRHDQKIALDLFREAQNKYVTKQKIAYMKQQNIEGLYSFDVNSDLGKQYMIDQNFCLNYAVANRKAMLQAVTAGVLENIAPDDDIHIKRTINRNHNHAEQLPDGTIIHRKGATHAELGMYGVIPGNMKDGSFIVKGKGNADSMCSSSHGAGRVLSRTKAKATLDLAEFRDETSKLVTNHTDAMLDEAPKAYKDIFEVMRLQSDLVEVIDRVIPILNIKG
jgi:tRNA-splicing ligase RtcB